MGKGNRARESALQRLAYQYWKRFGFKWVHKPKEEGDPIGEPAIFKETRTRKKQYKHKTSGGPRAITRRQRQIARGMLRPTEVEK